MFTNINGLTLQHVYRFSDIGVLVDPCLKFDSRIEAIARKAATVSWMIRTSFSSKDKNILKLVFCTYIRPNLEYSSSAWNPQIINSIKLKASRSFYKIISILGSTSAHGKTQASQSSYLGKRRLLADLTRCCKILNGFTNSSLKYSLLA